LLKAFDFVEVKKIQSPCMAPPMNYVGSANQPLSDIHREVKAERWIFLERDNK
jgi:hypothetical protein